MKGSLTRLFNPKSLLNCLILPALSFFLTTILIAAPANATGVYDLPSATGGDSTWVVDQGEVISRANEGKLSTTLKKLAEDTGNEVRMVAIRRLDYDETIDSFADRLFDTWYPSPEAKANQTLLVVDTLTNNIAIRTGEVVKQIMNDDIAESVANETVGLPIREGNKYNEAFLDARDRLVAVLSGEPDPGPPQVANDIQVEGTFTKAEDTNTGSATVWVVVILVLATVIPMATYFFYVGFPGNN